MNDSVSSFHIKKPFIFSLKVHSFPFHRRSRDTLWAVDRRWKKALEQDDVPLMKSIVANADNWLLMKSRAGRVLRGLKIRPWGLTRGHMQTLIFRRYCLTNYYIRNSLKFSRKLEWSALQLGRECLVNRATSYRGHVSPVYTSLFAVDTPTPPAQ